jgi:hypothetical protein
MPFSTVSNVANWRPSTALRAMAGMSTWSVASARPGATGNNTSSPGEGIQVGIRSVRL